MSDHASTDGTWEILQRIAGTDKRIVLHRIEPGGGAERNWNAATARARGEYVKLVCGDDLIRPTCVRRQLEARGAAPSARWPRPGATSLTCTIACCSGVVDWARCRARSTATRQSVSWSDQAPTCLGEPACVLVRRASRSSGPVQMDLAAPLPHRPDPTCGSSSSATWQLCRRRWRSSEFTTCSGAGGSPASNRPKRVPCTRTSTHGCRMWSAGATYGEAMPGVGTSWADDLRMSRGEGGCAMSEDEPQFRCPRPDGHGGPTFPCTSG